SMQGTQLPPLTF
nr:immunoglobulin light chain junction region [Macaca mulatta]MOX56130.1 immunoglobulin light chain junction region [Macaca mulatta]